MSGEAVARGWPDVLDVDLVRDLPDQLGQLADAIAQATGYTGKINAQNSDAGGFVVVNHGLPFTPSKVLVQSRSVNGGSALPLICTLVDSVGAATFRTRWYTTTGTGTPLVTAQAVPISADWVAYR